MITVIIPIYNTGYPIQFYTVEYEYGMSHVGDAFNWGWDKTSAAILQHFLMYNLKGNFGILIQISQWFLTQNAISNTPEL